MKKRLLSIALALSLVLSLCPWAMAADEVRETDFFTDYNAELHTDLKFSDIELTVPDVDAALATAKEAIALMDDGANAAAVQEKVLAVTDAYMMTLTMMNIAQVKGYQDYYNSDDIWDIYYENSSANYELYDIACALVGEVLPSPCGDFLKELVYDASTQEWYMDYAAAIDLASYTRYTGGEGSDGEGGTDEPSASDDPYTMNANLQNEYQDKLYEDYTVTYNGKEYTENDAYAAEANGELDSETANRLAREAAKKQNEVLGSIFVEMLPYRAQIAADYGYANYAENCYDYIYWYDYSLEDTRAFEEALKTYIAPLYQAISAKANDLDYYSGALAEDYTDGKALDMIAPYLGQMSSELLDSFNYMREHEMYDLTPMDTKYYYGSYTTYLYNYGTAFVFSGAYPDDGISNFDAAVHEFGHYNADFYNDGMGFFLDYSKTMDIFEVHSQGLELLMTHYYPEIFGGEADDVLLYKTYNFLYTLLNNALLDEFEQYAYTTPDVTLQQLNEKYCSLKKEYGLIDPDDPRTEMYGWTSITHLYQTPGYVISYATSLAGAFNFWLDAQTDFFSAVDNYLAFCALPNYLTFQESFAEIGLSDPLSAACVKELSEKLAAVLEDTGSDAISFSDVDGQWFAEYVLALAEAGVISGYPDGSFRPDTAATWGQALKMILIQAGYDEQAPVEGGHWASGYLALAQSEALLDGDAELDAAVSRQEAAELLAKALKLDPAESESPFADTDNGYVLALAELGIINGSTAADGSQVFNGQGQLKRSELCAILCRVMDMAAAEEAA